MGLGVTVGGACRDQGVQLGCMPRDSLLHLSDCWFNKRFMIIGGPWRVYVSGFKDSGLYGVKSLNPKKV